MPSITYHQNIDYRKITNNVFIYYIHMYHIHIYSSYTFINITSHYYEILYIN